MPRHVPPAAFRSMIVLGGLTLAGLGWGWTNWHSTSDLPGRGALAYAKGDFRQAAELARRRLKEAPEDLDALRVLARATARLGHDVSANALFARLGSTALDAEDLYLVGRGLNSAGQQESARRV